MNLISIDNVTKWQGDKKLFEDVSFGIEEGQKIALIGVNGCGKSTLLRTIAGKLQPDSGAVSWNKNARIRFLEQIPEFNSEDTVIEHIFKGDSPTAAAIKKYERLIAEFNHTHDGRLQADLDAASADMERLGAWQYESHVKAVLDKLGIDDVLIKMRLLSGGMLKKVALAAALIDESNLLLLDEPTNHLDISTVEWLQNFLQKTTKSFVLVTHDRYFLDNVCNNILEIDMQKIMRYEGNYSFYLEKKADIRSAMLSEDERIKSILRVELEWLKRGPKARGTKQKARIDRINEMTSREKTSDGELELTVTGRRLGKKILELKKISKAFDGRTIIKPFDYVFKNGERIGIIGPNGSGKTTFLNMLTGRLAPDTGAVDMGMHTHIGYFEQHGRELEEDITVIEYARKSGDMIKTTEGGVINVSMMLERFLFPPHMHFTKTSKLSGGEKRRLYLLNVLLRNPNFLVFDEPTNDLDVKTLSILENFLTNDYSGCLTVVSHDRYFMDRVIDYMLVFDGIGNISGFAGTFSDYMEYKKESESHEREMERDAAEKRRGAAETQKKQEDRRDRRKLSFNERREYETIEKEIEKLEEENSRLESILNSGGADHVKLSEAAKRQTEVENELGVKMDRWAYLAEIAGE